MKVLEPVADGFRNYLKKDYAVPADALLIDKAQLLTLTAPQMTVLVGGMRALGANVGGTKHGIFSQKEQALTNEFFVRLLDLDTTWKAVPGENNLYEGVDRTTQEPKGSATRVDLAIGSNSVLRALAEVYGSTDAQQKFVDDFVAAWTKVMNLGRYNIAR